MANLSDYDKWLNDSQKEAVIKLLNVLTSKYTSKGDLMELCNFPSGKVDSALPIDYVRRIQEINPEFKTHTHAMSYEGESYGHLVNVYERLFSELQSKLSER
tara:strand:+ start:963 stop:1268 length:306 start_codon:yes stop_codon:yes gene_type:complete